VGERRVHFLPHILGSPDHCRACHLARPRANVLAFQQSVQRPGTIMGPSAFRKALQFVPPRSACLYPLPRRRVYAVEERLRIPPLFVHASCSSSLARVTST
jgi:hypothetical protein